MWVKVILFYVAYCFLSDTTLLRLDSVKDAILVYTIISAFTIIEYSVFSYIIYSLISTKPLRIFILAASVCFLLFALYSLFTASDYSFDSLTASVEVILIVIYCIFYMFDQLDKPQVMFIYQEPAFWFVVGFMVYCSGNLFLFIQASNMEMQLRDTYWNILYSLSITKNILFAVALFIKKSKSIDTQSENPFDHDFMENPYKT